MNSNLSEHALKMGKEISLGKNKDLQDLFNSYFNNKLSEIEFQVGTATESFERQNLLIAMSVFAFYKVIF